MTEKIHILYADDDELIKKLIGGRLAKHGFDIIYASDGNEARETARRLQPDLIMLDYRMPVFDGLKTATLLKKEDQTKNLPVILLTNEDISLESQKFWTEIGLDGYIHKSAEFKDLLALLEKVLKKCGKGLPEAPQSTNSFAAPSIK